MTLASTYVLCPSLWLVIYFRVEGSCQNRGFKEVEQELKQTGIELGPNNVNLQTVRGHLGSCLVSSEGLFYQQPSDRSYIALPLFLSLPCLCYVMRCLLIYNWTIVITDLRTCDCACDRLVQSIYTSNMSQIYFT